MKARRRTTPDLPPLPSEDECVRAVEEMYADLRRNAEEAAERGHAYLPKPGVSADMVAHRLGVGRAHRAGRGAVKGSWSGLMAPGLRLSPRLRALARRGRLREVVEPEGRYRLLFRPASGR